MPSTNEVSIRSPQYSQLALLTGVAMSCLGFASQPAEAQVAQVINVCAGPAVNIPVLQPVAQVVDTSVISGIVNPLLGDLTGNINTNLTSVLSGAPLSVSLVDSQGNLVSASTNGCAITTNGQGGIQVGGGRIDGLGGSGNPPASAGSASAIAVGNGASTATIATNAVAVGTGAAVASPAGTAIGAGSQVGVQGGVALGSGSVANRLNAVSEAYTGIGLRQGLGTVSVGSVGAERQITNVAGATQDTDAINLRQLRAVEAGAVRYDLDSSGQRTNSATLIGGDTNAPVTIRNVAGGIQASDAVNIGQLRESESGSVRYDVDARGRRTNVATLAGGDPSAPTIIRNVAAGVQTTDAVNVGQLRGAQRASADYADQRFNEARNYTDQAVGSIRREARQAAAIGLAAGSLRYDTRPGKISLGASIGSWRGENAKAVGIGYMLPNGAAAFNVSASQAGSHWGVAGGMTLTLN